VRDEGDRTTSLAASITYSFTQLPPSDQLMLTAVSLFHGVVDILVLGLFSIVEGVLERFPGYTTEQWEQLLERAAAIGLLTRINEHMFQIHPALPAYLTAWWRRHDPDVYPDQQAAAARDLLEAYAEYSNYLRRGIREGRAEVVVRVIHLQRRSLSSMLGYALDQKLWLHALTIAQPLEHYWAFRGLSEEASAWFDRGRRALGDPGGLPPDLATRAGDLWIFMTSSQADWHRQANRLDDAERTYEAVLAALQQQPGTDLHRGQICAMYQRLGDVARDRGRLGDAERW
jgi:hypothetical protein